MIFEFREYCFIKWKFKFWNFLSEIRTKRFSIGRNFYSINWNYEENNPGVSGWFDRYSILVWLIEKNSRSIKTRKTEFFAEFSNNCSECLKRFQALSMVLWNILTLHTCLLIKYNPIDINREKHKKSYGYSLELLSVESKNLVVSWRQVCDNPLATRVWEQILSKDNNFVPPNYLFLFVLCFILILSLLITLCIIPNIHYIPQIFLSTQSNMSYFFLLFYFILTNMTIQVHLIVL